MNKKENQKKNIFALFKKEKKKTLLFFSFLFIVSIALLPKTNSPTITLLFPKKNIAKEASSQDYSKNLRKALWLFSKSDLSSLLEAQEILVTLNETKKISTLAKSSLCLAYQQLWPHSDQSLTSLYQIEKFIQKSDNKEKKLTEDFFACKAVAYLIKGKFLESKKILQLGVVNFKNSAALHFLQGVTYQYLKNPKKSFYFFKTASLLWPQWILPHIESAHSLEKLNRMEEAKRVFFNLIEQNNKLPLLNIRVGLFIYNNTKNKMGAIPFLKKGLKNISNPILASQGYSALADLYTNKSKKKSLHYANIAYQKNPLNSDATFLIYKYNKKLPKLKNPGATYSYLGNYHFNQKSYLISQAQYKLAFEYKHNPAFNAYKIAISVWNLGNKTEAISWLKKSLQISPDFLEAAVTLSEYYTEIYEYKKAFLTLNNVHKYHKEHYLMWYAWGLFEYKKKNFQKSKEYFKKSAAIYKNTPSLILYAESLLRERELSRAYEVASIALELEDDNPKVHSVYSQILYEIYGLPRALEHLDDFLDTFPAMEELYISKGQLYSRDSKFYKSEKSYKEALSINPNSKEAHINLGAIYKEYNEYLKSQQSYLSAIKLDIHNPEPIFQLADLYIKVKKYSQAKSSLERVLTLSPRYPYTHYLLATLKYESGDLNAAIELAKKEIKAHPQLSRPYFLIAASYKKKGDYHSCITSYQEAIKVNDQVSDTYVSLASCYRLLGQLEAGISILKQAATIESGNPNIYKEMGTIYSERGDRGLASESYGQYLDLNPNASDRKEILQKKQELE